MKKLSLNDACIIAESHGGICLSTEYKDNKTPLLWHCSKNHIWHAPLRRVKNCGTWCPHCAGVVKHTFEDIKKIALSKHGECLSTEYKNNQLPLLWCCKKNHLWYTSLGNVKNGKWCPYCAGNARLTLEDAKQIAFSRNGECLSTTYRNSKTPMTWKCHQGHIWNIPLNNIKNSGSWCPYCAGHMKLTLEDAKQIALSRHGECLSTEYKNIAEPLTWRCQSNHQWQNSLNHIKNRGQWYCLSERYYNSSVKLEWICKNKHRWKAIPNSIQQGCWCPYCAGHMQLTLEDAKQIALSRHGQCLSTKYKNNQLPLLWYCKEGHIWQASLSNVKSGTWCPFCYRFKREQLCREIVAKYLGLPSENRRPDFLKIPEHPKGLELDIPYYEYGFAIEVQGEQHEKYIEFFHRGDPNNFIKQQARDQLKKELCEENWITLRYVWYYEDPYVVIPEHLRELGLID
ncbi:hypothetical protein RhiirA1_542891 [Rhizophagus irregularis]|uniref:Zinc-ribbon domain-containing protein n=1 Tax=Rhizophagus irregularis TaxID=588596 RepID=A0A2N0QTM4_9GLOM|nr:hypothetical protein RhiirA1_542891 [Rhizophagus irregularis]